MSEDELLTGRAGNEAAAGYESMPVASPVDTPEPESMTEHELSHFNRPEPPAPVEREYRDVNTGEEIPENQTVSAEQAAHDVGLARESERAAREQRDADDLRYALDQLPQDGQPPTQQDQQPTAIDELQPEQSEAERDAARAQHDAAWAEADAEISKMLENPVVRERVEAEFNQVRQQAQSEVERAHNLSSAAQQHYVTVTNNLVAEANGLLAALAPELQGLNSQQEVAAALRVVAQQNPARAQALLQLGSKVQGLVEAQQRQQHQAAQGQAMQRDHELQQFTAAQEKRFEEATKYESPETMKAIRSQLYDVTEKAYGINKQTMQRIYSGEQRVDGAVFVRSAAFQLMLKDAVSYRLSKQAITQARSNPIPQVQKPGVSSGTRDDNSSYASLERELRGKDLTAKSAADLLIAHRARR